MGYGKGKSFPIHSGANNSAGIPRTLSAGEEVFDLGMMEFSGSGNSDGGRCPAFGGYNEGFAGMVALHFLSKSDKAFP